MRPVGRAASGWRVETGEASLSLMGDARAPGLIVHGVCEGHKCAREFGEDDIVIRRERPLLGDRSA